MRLDEKTIGKAVVFTVSGDLDSFSVNVLRGRISRHIESGAYNIVIDLTDVEFMDSTGLTQLVDALGICMHHGGDLALVSPNDIVRELLRVTKLEGVFRTFETAEGAAGALSE